MKTLHLNLKRKWFDMILSGEKKEEYRAITPYWVKRLVWDHSYELKTKNDIDGFIIDLLLQGTGYALKQIKAEIAFFNTITFSNGYAKNRDQFSIEFKGIEIREGVKEWGASINKQYFVLKLGIITYQNIKHENQIN